MDFDWEGTPCLTFGDISNAVLDITRKGDQERAQKFVNEYAASMVEDPESSVDTEYAARETVLSNIGYMSGYYDDDTRHAVQAIFSAAHPIFGVF